MLILRRKRFSIISKLKLFARRDKFPDNLRKEFELNEKLLKECDGRNIIDIQPSNEFKLQYKQIRGTNKERVDKFWKELHDDDASWFDDNGDESADTHYLADMSNTATTILDKRSVVFSKKINNSDRFNYRIYRPDITINEKGEKVYYQKITLCSCLEHTVNGKPGSYIKGQTGNTWHSSSKAAKRKRKLLKQNKKDDLK